MQEIELELRELISDNSKIYIICRKVAPSGMSRLLSFHVIKDNELYCINYPISKLLGYKFGKVDGLKITGCGMDMGFFVVNQLANKLGIELKHTWL